MVRLQKQTVRLAAGLLVLLLASCASAQEGWDDAPVQEFGSPGNSGNQGGKAAEGNPDRWEYDLERDGFSCHVKRKNERKEDGSRVAYILDLRIRPTREWNGPSFINIFWVTFDEGGRYRHQFSAYVEARDGDPIPGPELEMLAGGQRLVFAGEWKERRPEQGDADRAFSAPFPADEGVQAALSAAFATGGDIPSRLRFGRGWAEFILPAEFFEEYQAIVELVP